MRPCVQDPRSKEKKEMKRLAAPTSSGLVDSKCPAPQPAGQHRVAGVLFGLAEFLDHSQAY